METTIKYSAFILERLVSLLGSTMTGEGRGGRTDIKSFR